MIKTDIEKPLIDKNSPTVEFFNLLENLRKQSLKGIANNPRQARRLQIQIDEVR